MCPSRKHAHIILTPLKPLFYIVILGFTGVYNVLLISAQKRNWWVLYILRRNMKNIRVFLSENVQFLEVKFSIYLNRHVLRNVNIISVHILIGQNSLIRFNAIFSHILKSSDI